jgi:hypothetical protein
VRGFTDRCFIASILGTFPKEQTKVINLDIVIIRNLATSASHGQLYMIDSAEARSIITKDVPKVDNTIIDGIHDYLLLHHKYVRGYQTMGEKMRAERRAARDEGREPKELKLLFSLKEHVSLTELSGF